MNESTRNAVEEETRRAAIYEREPFLTLFEAELAALYERTRTIGERSPELGKRLALGSKHLQDSDISMRLLLEGAAYLGARATDRANKSEFRLALRMIASLFPGLLDAIPGRVLVALEPRQAWRVGRPHGPSEEITVMTSGGRGSYPLAPLWGIMVVPLTGGALGLRWMDGGRVAIDIPFTPDPESTDFWLRELSFAVAKSSGVGFDGNCFRMVGWLLRSASATIHVAGHEIPVRFDPAALAEPIAGERTRVELKRLMESLQWDELNGVILVNLKQGIFVSPGSSIVIRVVVNHVDKDSIAGMQGLKALANVIAFENRRVRESKPVAADLRRANTFIEFCEGPELRQPLIRPTRARVFKAGSNEEIADVRLVSMTGHQQLDRNGPLIVVHEASWILGDSQLVSTKFRDRIFLLEQGDRNRYKTPAVEVVIEGEVYDEDFKAAVNPGAKVSCILDHGSVDGYTVGAGCPPIADPPVRRALGDVLELGLPILSNLVETAVQDLTGYCRRVVAMLSHGANQDPIWHQVVHIETVPASFVSIVGGVSVAVRGWCVVFYCEHGSLAAGQLVAQILYMHHFLKSRCPVNTVLAVEIKEARAALGGAAANGVHADAWRDQFATRLRRDGLH